jgi:hypothetical protein
VVYKIDRLTRSLADFAKLVEAFDAKSISFVSLTQQFNTTTSMGRLTLNVLLSFAQFERELSSERVRDKVAASSRGGKPATSKGRPRGTSAGVPFAGSHNGDFGRQTVGGRIIGAHTEAVTFIMEMPGQAAQLKSPLCSLRAARPLLEVVH